MELMSDDSRQTGLPSQEEAVASNGVPEIKDLWYETETYSMHTIRLADMAFDTYGIVNKRTKVIEAIQPTFAGAREVSDVLTKDLAKLDDPQAKLKEMLGLAEVK